MKQSIWIKILIPVAIVTVITGLWFYKKQTIVPQPATTGDFALHATSLNLDALTRNNVPIILDFGADTCYYCVQMAPILEKLNAEYNGRAIIKVINTDQSPEIANQYPVEVLPTQLFFEADGSPYVPSADIGITFTKYNLKGSDQHALTVHQGALTEDQLRKILSDMGVSP